jgi:PKD repeat protein
VNELGMRIIFILGLLLLQLLIIGNIQSQANFYANQTEGCTDLNVKFIADYSGANTDTINLVKWHFGEGDTIIASNKDSIRHSYHESGNYTVVMVINNKKKYAIVRSNYITVHPTVSAAFQIEQLGSYNNYQFTGIDDITDTNGLYIYTWGYQNVSTGDNTNHTYTVDYNTPNYKTDGFTFDTGLYRVSLNITDSYGCTSDFERALIIAEEIPPIPNVFVPQVHEFFIIDPQDASIVLQFQLFNRNGMMLFKQEAPVINWDGKSSSGYDLSTGVYFYILKATSGDPLGRYSKNGFIHVFRK